MENTLPHIVNYEKAIFERKKLEKCDMTSFYLEKPFECFKIQEILRSENRREYYLCKRTF